jgi:prepilin-type N-terminal cleavage/methylation domain-containing protein/prepilin-type processing-associated H-X9-DG protein
MSAHRARQGFTLIELLVVLAILAILLGLLTAAIQRVRAASARTVCSNHLRQIGIALNGYHDAHGFLPPGVSYRDGADPYPFMSWNTHLLPFLEQSTLWAQAERAYLQTSDFRVSPPHLLATVVEVYTCPVATRTLEVEMLQGVLPVTFTAYLGVEGTNQFRQDGLLFLDSRIRFADVTDGLSNTLAVGERPPSADGRFGWWYAGWGQNKEGSGEMVLGVRERHFSTSLDVPCPPGPYEFGPGRVDNQCDMFHFWSMHINGGHFLFADGSVHFLNYAAAPLLPALATRNGGEPASLPE